jgi:Trp operon repressor
MVYENIDITPITGSENDSKIGIFLKRYKKAEGIKDYWKEKFEEAYEFTMPQRESFFEETPGSRRTDKIFDETAVVGIQEFASRLQAGMTPTFARWADFEAGSEIPEEMKPSINEQLDTITSYVFEVLQSSNFNTEVHESFMDLAIGTGCLLVEEGDAVHPLKFNAIPLPRLTLNNGPDNKIDQIFRTRYVDYEDLQTIYPRSLIPIDVLQRTKNSRSKCLVVEGTMRLYDEPNVEKYKYCVVLPKEKIMIEERILEGNSSNPYIVFRWNKASGEVYGRGPVFNAMAAIKTTNLTVELILQNAQMAVSGIYTFEDDGVINPDNVQLVPGSLIPVSPGSRGLVPIAGAGDFNVAQLILSDMRQNIKKALYMEALGKPEGTPMSATEVSERMADLSRQIGSSFGRLQSEFVTPLLKRIIRILTKQGRIELPKIDGKEVKVVPRSPLAKAQHQQDVADVTRFNEIIGMTFGPQMLNMIVKQDEVAKYLAEKMNLPEKLIRDAAEQQELANQLQTMQQQGTLGADELERPQGQ